MPDPLYWPLNFKRHEIRLLRVEGVYTDEYPGDFDVPLTCELVLRSLDLRFEFEALSYAWGDDSANALIDVGGHSVHVTRNLERALKATRYCNTHHLLWVDAICINQKDVRERNQQVQLMRHIYKRATRVNIWLGSPFPGVGDLFKKLKDYAENGNLMELLNGAEISQSGTEIVRNITRVIELEWWWRVWVLQEAVIPNKANIFCGACFMDFGDLLHVWNLLHKNMARREDSMVRRAAGKSAFDLLSAALLQAPRRFRNLKIVVRQEDVIDLPLLLATAAWSKASDPRDKVYGIQGLLPQPIMAPDYNKHWKEVYADCAASVLESTGSFALFTLISGPSSDPTLLPSWVVDWRYPTHSVELLDLYNLYRSPNSCSPVCLHLDSTTLQLSVKVVGRIDEVGPVYPRHQFHELSEEFGDRLFNVISAWVGISGIPERDTAELRTRAEQQSQRWNRIFDRAAKMILKTAPNFEQELSVQRILDGLGEDGELSTPETGSDCGSENGSSPDLSERQTECEFVPVLSAATDVFWRTICMDVVEDEKTGELRRASPADAVRICNVIYWIVSGMSSNPTPEVSWNIDRRLANMRMFKTADEELIGLGKEPILEGDLIALVQGANMPFVLRRANLSPSDLSYRLISPCYVHQLMDEKGSKLPGSFKHVNIV